jgi:hypothetical protein
MILSPNGLNSDVVYPRGSWNPAMTRGLVLPRECHHQTFRPMTADMEIVCEQLCSCPCCFCFLSVLSNCHARPADSSTNELEDIIGNWHDSFHLGLREAPPRERSTGWRKVPAAGDFPAWDLYGLPMRPALAKTHECTMELLRISYGVLCLRPQ